MKISRNIIYVITVTILGLGAACWAAVQSAHPSGGKAARTDNYIALHLLEAFMAHLQETGQTNTIQRFNEYCNATIASRNSAELGVTMAILMRLRAGSTAEAVQLLETRLTSDVVGFAASYRELSPSIRDKVGLAPLKDARDYCSKYHVKESTPDLNQVVSNAFKLLDAKSGR